MIKRIKNNFTLKNMESKFDLLMKEINLANFSVPDIMDEDDHDPIIPEDSRVKAEEVKMLKDKINSTKLEYCYFLCNHTSPSTGEKSYIILPVNKKSEILNSNGFFLQQRSMNSIPNDKGIELIDISDKFFEKDEEDDDIEVDNENNFPEASMVWLIFYPFEIFFKTVSYEYLLKFLKYIEKYQYKDVEERVHKYISTSLLKDVVVSTGLNIKNYVTKIFCKNFKFRRYFIQSPESIDTIEKLKIVVKEDLLCDFENNRAEAMDKIARNTKEFLNYKQIPLESFRNKRRMEVIFNDDDVAFHVIKNAVNLDVKDFDGIHFFEHLEKFASEKVKDYIKNKLKINYSVEEGLIMSPFFEYVI